MTGSAQFRKDLEKFAKLTKRRALDAFAIASLEVQRSVVEGSELTGAPGQPVDTGELRKSWIGEFAPLRSSPKGGATFRATSFTLTTNLVYAPFIEAGANSRGKFRPPGTGSRKRNGREVKSTVGGFHSVKLTAAGWPRIVNFAVKRAGGE